MEEIKKEIASLGAELSKKLETIEDGRQANEKSLKELWADFKAKTEELNKNHNAVIEKMKALELAGGAAKGPETFHERLMKSFKGSEAIIEKLKTGEQSSMVLKDIMNSTDNLAGPLAIRPTTEQASRVYGSPTRRLHVRDILPTGTSNSAVTEVFRETAKAGSPAAPVSNELSGLDLKPESENNFAMTSFGVKTIAHLKRFPESWLTDYPAIAAYLDTIGISELLNVEDQQLITGSGVGVNLTGLANTVGITAFAPGIGNTVPFANTSDILLYSIAQLAQTGINGGGYTVDFIAMSPMDHAVMLGAKKSDGEYVIPNLFSLDGRTFMGIPVIPHNAIPAGNILLGDSMNCQIQFVSGLSVGIFREDRDNVPRNLITVRIEERLKFPVYQPQGFMYINIATARAAIIAP